MENKQLNLQLMDNWGCHMLYTVSGALEGNIEVQFDENKFNGKILFAKDNDEGNGELDWNPVTDEAIFTEIKEKAIEDYNKS